MSAATGAGYGLMGFWSVTVRANWRIMFRFEEAAACDVELIDYH